MNGLRRLEACAPHRQGCLCSTCSSAPPESFRLSGTRRLVSRRTVATGLAAALLLALSCDAPAQEATRELKPPFGLNWGETTDRLEKLLQGVKARIVDRRTIDNTREAWDVEGLLQSGLKRTVFTFRRGELIGVELQYDREGWKDADYDRFMGEIRRRLEQKYGVGQQIVRRTEPEGAVVQTLVGYQWNMNNTAIELFYFLAKQGDNEFRTLSVHYKAF